MYKPRGLINVENNALHQKQEIPRSLVAFFFILQFCFGINFGFNNYLGSGFKYIATFTSVLVSLAIFAVLCTPFFSHDLQGRLLTTAVQYLLYTGILSLTKLNFYDFIFRISSIGEKIPQLENEILGFSAIGYASILFITKLIISFLYCNVLGVDFCTNIYYIPYYIYIPATFTVDAISIIFILINYYIYCCVKKINNLAMGAKLKLKHMQDIYLKLTDIYDKIMPLYDKLITVELLFEVPKLMFVVWYLLYMLNYHMNRIHYVFETFNILYVVVRIFTPSVLTEMVNSQVEALKLKLHFKVLEERDEETYNKILHMLSYMEARSLEHKVWRLIPLDIHLPLTLLSICVTYLIVVVQFTHLYD